MEQLGMLTPHEHIMDCLKHFYKIWIESLNNTPEDDALDATMEDVKFTKYHFTKFTVYTY